MKIKEIRVGKGYTQKQLSLLSGVSQGKISEYESGGVIPRADTALKIAKALECSLDALMDQPSTKAS